MHSREEWYPNINTWILNSPAIDSIQLFMKIIVSQNKKIVVDFMLEECMYTCRSQERANGERSCLIRLHPTFHGGFVPFLPVHPIPDTLHIRESHFLTALRSWARLPPQGINPWPRPNGHHTRLPDSLPGEAQRHFFLENCLTILALHESPWQGLTPQSKCAIPGKRRFTPIHYCTPLIVSMIHSESPPEPVGVSCKASDWWLS